MLAVVGEHHVVEVTGGDDSLNMGKVLTEDGDGVFASHAADYFLDERAGFVTGQVLYVCGGMTIGVAAT